MTKAPIISSGLTCEDTYCLTTVVTTEQGNNGINYTIIIVEKCDFWILTELEVWNATVDSIAIKAKKKKVISQNKKLI